MLKIKYLFNGQKPKFLAVIITICLIVLFFSRSFIYNKIFNVRPGENVGLPETGNPSAFDVQLVGTTNTQAVLSYTAPDTEACSVQVSENSSLTPLAHDVDPGLFTGADMDNRGEAISNEAKRIFVIGKRLTQKALDGKNYSRALQAYKTHYYRITCGAVEATGSFDTKNIPFGMTYQDIPQLDPATPGAAMKPTLTNDRAQTIIDPHTGALIKRVNLPADSSGTGPYMYFGGSTRICSNNLMGSPAIGYLCAFANGNGGYGVLYYIIPSTGEARYLGSMPVAYPLINPTDGKFYEQSGDTLIAKTYTGDYSAAAPNTSASLSNTTIITGVRAAVHTFNNNFVAADFGCGVDQFAGDYAAFVCARGGQDSYGWIAVFSVSTGNAVAAMQLYQNALYRWTAIHHLDAVYDAPAVLITTHGLVGSTGGGNQLGLGPYITTYTGGGTLPIGSTVLAVSGEPACSACGADSDLPLAQVGDSFTFSDNSEVVKIVTKNSPTSWVITPTTMTHAPGTILTATGNYTPIFWKFLQDPSGADTTGVNVVSEMKIDGHADITTDLLLMEHWQVRVGDLLAQAGKPWTRTISESPLFAGAFAQCYGNGCASHPSAGAPGQPWLTDYLRWDGAYADAGTITPVSGQLYQFYSSSYGPPKPKQMAQAGNIGTVWNGGPFGLLNVSSPTAILGTGPEDSYKYCIANSINECRSGSAKGDMFINLPGTPATTCSAGPCLSNFDAYGNGVLQIGVSGNQSRVISGGLTGLADMGGYPTAKSLADGSWLLFNVGDTQYKTPSQLLMAKLPPFASEDSVDRATFIRAPIVITPPADQQIASAVVEFGYAEHGTPDQHYCTSRKESCVATSSTVSDANPFNYEQTDTYAKMPCVTGCTITLPVLPMHVAYYQVKYYNAAGVFIAYGDQGVAAESAIANINYLIVPTPPSPPADTTPPVISAINTSAITVSGATISWTTNEAGDTQVEYGTTASYGQTTALYSSLVTSHSVSLSGLNSGALYHYRVKSRDSAANLGVSLDQTFTSGVSITASPAPSPAPAPGPASGSAPAPPPTPAPAPIIPSIPVIIPPAPQNNSGTSSSVILRLINDQGTYYLIQDNQRRGITNPGMLYSYGFSLEDAQTATAQDQSLPQGPLLLPADGALVKSKEDRTVYLISQKQRYGFTSAKVFAGLGFKFSSILEVTDPELQALSNAAQLLNDGGAKHPAGLDINKNGTVYLIGPGNMLHAYPSVDVYNSWHIDNDFSTVVPANSADIALPVGDLVAVRAVD